MNAYEHVLVAAELPPDARWREFFGHIHQATVVDAGLDLARALDSADYTVVYSTTRPSHTHAATRAWLASRDFPPGRALLSRPNLHEGHHPAPAWQVKRGHARAATNKHNAWLKAFVDDDPAIIERLRASGIPPPMRPHSWPAAATLSVMYWMHLYVPRPRRGAGHLMTPAATSPIESAGSGLPR